jgi:hypothetical protein
LEFDEEEEPAPAEMEFNIPYDETEAHRMALEQNLLATDLSLHLSSAASQQSQSDAETEHERDYQYERKRRPAQPQRHAHHDESSVEYGRHASHPSMSFRTADASSHGHDGIWSYADDDGGEGHSHSVYYDGQSLSTAQHHASAVTLNAGLGRYNGYGRQHRGAVTADISLSGAEYDPERPLHDMIAGIGVSRLSALDATSHSNSHVKSRSMSKKFAVCIFPSVLPRIASIFLLFFLPVLLLYTHSKQTHAERLRHRLRPARVR